MMTNQQRMDLLASYGATGSEIEELLAYDRNAFDEHRTDAPPVLPLPAESHVAAWKRYALEAAEAGGFAALQRRLVQLRFPIREGISQTEPYRAATLRGSSYGGNDRGIWACARAARRASTHRASEPGGADSGLDPRRSDGLRGPCARLDHEKRARNGAGIYGGVWSPA